MLSKIRKSAALFVSLAVLSASACIINVNTATEIPLQIGVGDATDATDANDLISYTEVARNDKNIMYADLDKGFFAVKNIESGAIWYSTPNDTLLDDVSIGLSKNDVKSQIIVYYIYTADEVKSEQPESQSSQIGCINSGSVEVKKISDGIKVIYNFEACGFVIPGESSLSADYVDASVDIEAIEEKGECTLTGINLLPFFGAGNSNDSGYMVVPDGCGAVINFNNGAYQSTYEKNIYGEDMVFQKNLKSSYEEDIRLPVFGISNGDGSLLGVITEGDASASLRVVGASPTNGYNCVSSKINLRTVNNKTLFSKDSTNRRIINRLSQKDDGLKTYSVRYYPLAKGSGYVEMAEKYREYLISEKGLNKVKSKPSLAVDFYGVIDKSAAFFGIPYTKMVPLTTFKEAMEITDELKKSGIENISARYIGWEKTGVLNNKAVYRVKASSKLGGAKEFKKLISYMSDNSVDFYPQVDFLNFRSGKNGIKSAFNETVYKGEYLRSVYATKIGFDDVMLLSVNKVLKNAQKYLSSYLQYDSNGISLGVIGEYLYSDFNTKAQKSRDYFKTQTEKLLSDYKAAGLKLALNGANAYTLGFVSKVYGVPEYSSGYKIFDRDIPFYQIVIHGYIPFTGTAVQQSQEPQLSILNAAETGSEVLYSAFANESSVVTGTRYEDLYSSSYNLWKQDAAELYKEYMPLLQKVYDSTIVSHSELLPDVMQTVFENGVEVVVNYNNKSVELDGVIIDAMSFTYKG